MELFDLRDDIGEQRNLAAAQPAKTSALRAALHRWLKDTGAAMPTRNADFDPKAKEGR